ncbi:MAG TPA: hypothetical protein VF842_05260 [Flavobacterium sp.]
MARAIRNTCKKEWVNNYFSSIGIYDTPLKSVLVPYRKLADVIEASDLDCTILRPEWFTSANEVRIQNLRIAFPLGFTEVTHFNIKKKTPAGELHKI